jgi:alpha-beta hydrolase superfamily lysophospholipase
MQQRHGLVNTSRSTAPSDTVVLIHGLWLTPLAWEHWVSRYEERGFRVLTRGYPGVEGGTSGVGSLRADPACLVNVGVRDVLDHLTDVVSGLVTQPILMGHSFGGALVQLLVDAGLGAAGVSIHGAGVNGVSPGAQAEIGATLPTLKDPANRRRGVLLTPEEFHLAFANTLSKEASSAAHDRYAVPVSGRILFDGGFASLTPHAATTYNFANDDRAPLLFISGGSDQILPPAVQRENYDRNASHSNAITAYRLYPGRDHYTCGEPGWEAVADFALGWALDPIAGVIKERERERIGG